MCLIDRCSISSLIYCHNKLSPPSDAAIYKITLSSALSKKNSTPLHNFPLEVNFMNRIILYVFVNK